MSERDADERTDVRALPELVLRRHGRLTAGDHGDELLTMSVGPAGEAIGLWCSPDDVAGLTSMTTEPGGAAFPDSRAARPADIRITVHCPDLGDVVRVAAMPLAYPSVQPLPGGRSLAVGGRCLWRPEGPDRNAIMYASDGTVAGEYTLGDGIEDVFTTPSGQAWVSYFDEGVFGNYGWGGPGPAPLGACGLARFGPAGEPRWRFPSDGALGIADCYALNVVGETAWACYYTDFPVVRVQHGQVTSWRNELASGVRGLIVDDGRVALVGGYSGHRDRLVVAELGDGALREVGRYRLVLPDGRPLPDRVRVVGRGDRLHIFHGLDWFQMSMDDIVSP
ncbi:hypothetical protein HH310_22585 [Actinoplanes sp. TBRC 11911]|uniref:hypothetical protein n=1 Tax=Actinoplanes sp. TBRC 11911 TaxID=2729386 RepID=UPI00145FB465|nr:hypothetical protein [Actinoplanes sp. TBRC 11911]NMO53955.1 hypothetical protein [Actinoplanes sp. TBRC 11911]